MKDILQNVSHRPWPLPSRAWVMAQSWHDLLFAHWPVETAKLRPHIPKRLAIDTFYCQAWIAVVPFRMTGVRLRGTPALPWLSAFPELNVRTYVTCDGKPGVWFFSLDAGNPVAVAMARAWFHLPYFRARMLCSAHGGWIQYSSERTHSSAPPASLLGAYRASGPPVLPQSGTLEHFLTERYCLYAADPRGRIIRAEIHHLPWPLQRAEAAFQSNAMTQALDIPLTTAPLLHFSKRQDVLVWRPRQLPEEPSGSSTN